MLDTRACWHAKQSKRFPDEPPEHVSMFLTRPFYARHGHDVRNQTPKPIKWLWVRWIVVSRIHDPVRGLP